jgi:hypothetical protein
MTQLCIILKSISSFCLRYFNASFLSFVISLSFFSVEVRAAFRTDSDRQVVQDVLTTFASECTAKASIDSDKAERIKAMSLIAQKQKVTEINMCYAGSMSQITSVVFIFEKMCSDIISNTSNVSDSTLAKQLIEVTKYQTGIRPYHMALNDCLGAILKNRGSRFIEPLTGNDVTSQALLNEIEMYKIPDPFSSTVEPFR